jgi:hypothetical protein
MKPRRVIVTIEMTTSVSLKEIKSNYSQSTPGGWDDKVHQVQVNVIKDKK